MEKVRILAFILARADAARGSLKCVHTDLREEVVKELVEAHGGKVGAELTGERVVVWFELPISPATKAD